MENLDKDEMRREIPAKFRASTEAADKAAYEILQENDRQQMLLAESVGNAFTTDSPIDRMRSKALATIREYEEIVKHQKLMPNQTEELAESYALVGQFKKAAETTLEPLKRTEYIKTHAAVWLDDADWCNHGERAKFVKANVWSIKERREMPLIACAECGKWNVLDAPERLVAASALRAEVRKNRVDMSSAEFDRWIEQHKRKVA